MAFAFAIAAMISGNLDQKWARWTRPWTTWAWLFLTVGIALGSWWAYYELGWGGWWFWDPVENASFMPWLVATALIHSLAVTEQRGPCLEGTPFLGYRQGMHQRRTDQPGHEGRVLDRVPKPETTPPQFVVGPPGT